jgi:hypothetical protein
VAIALRTIGCMTGNQNIAADVLKGAIAGAVATWLMDRATTWMYEQESEDRVT